LYQRFSATEDLSGYDYIVIGSGIGGLSTAIFLSKAGKKVLVLESHYVPGGFSQTFKRNNGFVWDVGVHYVGNMDKENSFLRKMTDYLTDKKLNWEFMGDVYDVVHIGKDSFSFVAGKEKLRSKLHGYFPEEKSAIDLYFKKLDQATRYARLFFLQKSFPWILQLTIGKLFKALFRKYSSRTTYEILRTLTGNEKLISVLCSQCGNYGLPPRKSSFGVHAVVTNHFLEGGYYPVGGSAEIYNSLVQTLLKDGGQLRIRAKVDEIVVDDGHVSGVKVSSQFIPCKNVISNAGAENTYSKLLAGAKWNKITENLKSSTAHLCLYIGLDRSDAELNLPRHNVWYYAHYDFEEIIKNQYQSPNAPLQFAYLSFPSAKDPHWKEKNPGKATIQATGPALYEWFKDFENTHWMKRGPEYDGIKNAFKGKMLEKLYELFPQIKGHVVHAEVSSPLSTNHFTNYRHGEIYGLEHSPDRFKLKLLQPKSSIKGLYLVGQDIVTVGVGGALASALLCSTQILKFQMAKQFKAMVKGVTIA
jgi:all-trans-retinol 13,14-reductase